MRNALYLLGIAIVILVIYSIDVTTKHNRANETIHAMYTNELANASEKLTLLQHAVSQSLLFQDERALSKELNDVWRLSSDVRNSLARLPFQAELTNGWMNYLGRLGDEAKRADEVQDSAGWHKRAQVVANNLKQLENDWTVATTRYFEQDGDVEKWQKEIEKPQNFGAMAKQLKTFKESDFPLTASESDFEKRRDLQYLSGKDYTKEEVLKKFYTLFPHLQGATVKVALNKDEASYPFYHIQFVKGASLGYADMTKKGGHILSYLLERPVQGNVFDLPMAREKAEQYVAKLQLSDVVYTEARENHTAWHFVFTRKVDGALVYPDSIQLKIAKDTGELLGINMMEYVQKETLPSIVKMPLDWSRYLTKDAVVEEERFVYTRSKSYDLVPCYEAIVRLQNDQQHTYRILVHGKTHEVVALEALE